MTLIKDHWTAWKGVEITFTVQPLWSKIGVKFFPLYIYISTLFWSFFISPDEDLLFEVETGWVKLLCKFQCWQSEKTYISNVFKYIFKSSRWTFSIKQYSSDQELKRLQWCGTLFEEGGHFIINLTYLYSLDYMQTHWKIVQVLGMRPIWNSSTQTCPWRVKNWVSNEVCKANMANVR